MRILRLTLTKKWFNLILSGGKVWEYREYKKHWIQRLTDKNEIRAFDEIHFTNGYGSGRPFIRAKFIGQGIMKGVNVKPENGEPIDADKSYFVISIGDLIETKNVKIDSAPFV